MISSLSVRLMKIEHKSVSRRNQERKKNGRNFGTWKTKLLSLLGSNNSFGVTISLQPNSSKIGEKIVRIVKMSTKSNLHHHCQCQWKVSPNQQPNHYNGFQMGQQRWIYSTPLKPSNLFHPTNVTITFTINISISFFVQM